MIQAYEIGVSMVLDQARILGPLADILKAMEGVQKACNDTQIGLNGMIASLRGADRVANSFADAMNRAAQASGRMGVGFGAGGTPGGGAGAGGGRGGRGGAAGLVGRGLLQRAVCGLKCGPLGL